MTHGTAMVKALGTRNRFSATSVDQLPHQLVAHLMFGHQLFLPGPRHRPHVVLPGLRRQPDGLQRLPDDRPRLPQPAARAQRPRRPDGRVRPAPHRDREGRHRAPLRPAGHRRVRAAGDAPRGAGRGPHPGAGVRRRAGRGGGRGRGVHAGAGRGAQRRPGRRDPPHRPGVRRRRRRGRLRADRRLHARVRLGLPVGGQPAQHRHRQPRPRSAARCSPPPRSTPSAPA